MDTSSILANLKKERRLLQKFLSLSEVQLGIIDNGGAHVVDGIYALLDERAELILELTAVEATLGTWIPQVQENPSVSEETIQELQSVNNEIVETANTIVAIDERVHHRLQEIKREELRKERPPKTVQG